METPFPGLGTLLNVATVLVGGSLGLLVGDRLPERVRDTVTDCLGLVTLLVAALSAVAVTDPVFVAEVGAGVPVLVVLGALVIGGVLGSLARIEGRLEGLGGVLHRRLERSAGADPSSAARRRFVQGWMTTSLLFCVGPLTVLGSLDDGLGRGIDQLALKSVLDGFAALAFASSLGIGVLASALSVLVVQGLLTLVGVLLGAVVPEVGVLAMTAAGGLLLFGLGLRLLRVREIPVGDLLPAILVAPALAVLVAALR